MNDDLHVPVEQEDFSDADEQEDFPDADEQEDFSERDEQEDFSDADEQEEPLVPVRHRPPRKSGGQRHKVLWVALGILAALAAVSWMLNQSLGPGAVNTTGVSTHQATSTPIPTIVPVTPIPTAIVRGAPVGPTGGPTATLALLSPRIAPHPPPLWLTAP